MNARILKEYKEMQHPMTSWSVSVGLFDENDITRWKATFLGPKDTVYKGGLFFLSIQFPQNYPESPPEVCFLTPIYNPYVNSKIPKSPEDKPLGSVYLPILNNWKKETKCLDIIVELMNLFHNIKWNNSYEFDIADEMKNNREIYEFKARHFTKKYATPHYKSHLDSYTKRKYN